VWEKHEEQVEIEMKTKVPVFTEINDKEIHKVDTNNCNFLLEGDNLHSLHLLRKTHRNSIDIIYIDPPYNTKNKEFIYSDTCVGEDDGFRHSKRLSFMEKRLNIARSLLKDDGLIFISIDDNELAPLTMLCNEIFGEANFIDNIIWKKRYGGGAKEKYLVTLQEYILVYAKNISAIEEITVPLSQESIDRYYKMKDENYNVRSGVRTHPLEANKTLDERKNLVFPITAPDGADVYPKRQWLWSKERVAEALAKNELYFSKSKTGEWSVQTKQYLKDYNGVIRRGKFFSIIDGVYTQYGTNEMINFFGNAKAFSFPKPTELIKQLLSLCNKHDALILDFFAGSGTTGQAVLELNKEYGTNHKFILCTNNENRICEEITYNRLLKVMNGYCDKNANQVDGIPANLKYYKTEFIPKILNNVEYSISDKLLNHIKEMVQLEHGVSIDNENYILLFSDDHADEIEKNKNKLSKCKCMYISSQVLLSSSQEKIFNEIGFKTIPDYYFEEELSEVGETW
jgi:adenine-specific DNA-methyltransferase